jgi:hypothetical protein
MTQAELERALVRATGESRQAIRQHGFMLIDEEAEPLWDPKLAIDCPGCGNCLSLDSRSRPRTEFIDCPRCDASYPYSESEVYVTDGEAGYPALKCA